MKKKRQIGYISQEIPKVEFPPCEGERDESLVPDTLDLAERADSAIHCLTSVADPEADYEIWWHVLLNRRPPIMYHDFHDLNVQFKFQEALPLLRVITGNDINLDVDRGWAEALLHMQGKDGLVYMPVVGRPWARYHADWLGGKGDDGTSDQLASIIANGGWIGVMGLYYLLSNDKMWKDRVQRLIDRMARLMVYRDDYCYFPIMAANPGAKVSPKMEIIDPKCTEEAGGACAGWIIQGLCQAYLATAYEPALDLAGKLAVYLKEHSGCYDEEGRFTGIPHTHLHTRPISGLLEYALITKNREMIEFCRKAYEYTKSCGSSTVGFFPPTPGPDTTCNYATIQKFFQCGVEGCTVADMVALAIKLSQAGVADYWDDVDRYTRNQFAEIQVLKTDWVERAPVEEATTPWAQQTRPWLKREFQTADRVAERNIGACMSVSSPNDFVGHPIPLADRLPYDHLFFMHCCTGNYARAIPYIWDNMLNFEDGTLTVNLLLNRPSPWADVESYIPYEGRADIKVKKSCRLLVRIPEWVKPQEAVCKVNGQAREPGWDGRYAQVGNVKPGDALAVTFPIGERTVKETLCGADYTLIIKGNTVVFIDPPSKYYPFYQRAHYREKRVRWVKRSRFVSSKPSLCWHY